MYMFIKQYTLYVLLKQCLITSLIDFPLSLHISYT